MSSRWVVNASPLILLGKVDQLRLLRDLAAELVIPEGVAREVQARPDGAQALETVVTPPVVRIERSVPIPREIEAWDLGRGES